MKQSLMSRLEQPNGAVSIRAACRRLGAQDVTARPWNTPTKSHSPPVGRFVQTTGLTVFFQAPRGPHSAKPDYFYDTVRRITAGRRLDMFGRRAMDGFDSWGYEAPAHAET